MLQGNGTAAIFEDDPRVTTFDMHGAPLRPTLEHLRLCCPGHVGPAALMMPLEGSAHMHQVASVEPVLCAAAGDKNYPWKTRRRCTHDVPLPDGMEDDAYMEVQNWYIGAWVNAA